MAAAAIAHPGNALAHGVAHHREHEHEAEHRPGAEQQDARTVSGPEHGHDHAHGNVDDASIRTRIDPQATVPEVDFRCAASRDVVVDTPSARAPLARGDPSTGPPPRLRAPPTR